ncbi:MAG: fatty acid desaturase [Terriglobales bacterium]
MATKLAAPIAETRPWEWPWWRSAPGEQGVLIYLILIHALALAGLILFPLPGWRVFTYVLVLGGIGGLGTTICYHRLLAHRTFKLNKWVEQALIFAAMFNGSGSPASWVAYHRLHHSQTDTEGDISSPNQGGFWWAHLRWLYQTEPADTKRWAPELTRGSYRFWTYAQIPVLLFSLCCGLLVGGWAAFLWMGAFRLTYSLHAQCFVNSLTHLGAPPEGGVDRSQNVWWLGPLQLTAWGENWHRNHHSAAGLARFSRAWWQVDVGWYCIVGMEALGLATNVKRRHA